MPTKSPYRLFRDPLKATDIIDRAKRKMQVLGIKNPSKTKFRHFVLDEAGKHKLSEIELRSLTRHLGIDWFSPPRGIPKSWVSSICKQYMSVKYTNPENEEDYVVLVSSRSIFGLKGVIRHTPKGYVDTSWFTDFVPHLDELATSYKHILTKLSPSATPMQKRGLISAQVNDPLNAMYASKGMKPEQLKAVHAFFKEYLPGLEGICENCFKLLLPKAGFGERWFSAGTEQCEVRLSTPKHEGKIGQKVLYVTHSYKREGRESLHVCYEGIIREPPSIRWSNGPIKPSFKNRGDLESVHIPWEIYDYAATIQQLSEPLNLEIKVCQCPS